MNDGLEKNLQLFIRQVTTAAANASLYSIEHPQVFRLCGQALEQLQLMFNEARVLTLKIIDERLVFQDRPVTANLSVERLISALRNRDVSFLQLTPGVCSEELLTLVKNLTRGNSRQGLPRKTEHIQYGRIGVERPQGVMPARDKSTVIDFSSISDRHLDQFMDIYSAIGHKKALNVVGIGEIVNNFISAFGTHGDVLLALAPLRSMDEYVYVHSTNICLLNLAQARLLGIEGPLLNEIGIAAMLHDVGKMFIPADILNKQGKLDNEEWQIMQRHPQLGAEYLLASPGIPRLAVLTAYEHHIGYDGKGYPRTPYNWQLNTCSHMTAISDVYDALRTRRAYKEPLSFEQVNIIMCNSAGKELHPELTRSFLSVLEQLEKSAA